MKTYLGRFNIAIIWLLLSSCDQLCGDHGCDESSHLTSIFIENQSDKPLVIYLEEGFPSSKDDLYDTLKLIPDERLFVSSIARFGGSGDAILGGRQPYGPFVKSKVIFESDTLDFTNGVTDGVYDSTVCQDPLNPLCKENYKVILATETKREELFILLYPIVFVDKKRKVEFCGSDTTKNNFSVWNKIHSQIYMN